MKEKNISARSAMQVALITRLLGITVTVFILILTVKSELLNYRIITWQLVLAIPLLFVAMISNSKIISRATFKEYRTFNLMVNSVSIALILNTFGLLVSKYVSAVIGTAFFLVFLGCYSYFLIKDWKTGKIYNELLIMLLLLLFGFLPSFFILT